MNLKVLKTFAGINNGIVMTKGKEIATISQAMNLYAVHHTPSDFDFAIYDLNSFLSVVSITSDRRDVQINERVMTIQDGKTKLKYFGSSPNLIITPPDDVSSLTEADYYNHFTISAEEFKQLMTACAVMRAKSVVFECSNGEVSVSTEADYSDSNSYETVFSDIEDPQDTKAKLDVSTIKAPADTEYRISIGERAIRFSSEETDYYIVRAE